MVVRGTSGLSVVERRGVMGGRRGVLRGRKTRQWAGLGTVGTEGFRGGKRHWRAGPSVVERRGHRWA